MASKGISMKCFLLILCLAFNAQATPLKWDGGNLQFDFSSNPYHQREPKISREESQTLNSIVKLIKQKRDADAMAELKVQMNRKPSAALWFALAQLQKQQKQVQDKNQQAIESLQQAIALLPDFTRAHEALGMLLTQAGEFVKAHPHLSKAAAHGSRAEIYAMLGYGYLQTEQPQSAQAAYSHALMLAGDNRQWQQGLLYSALAAGDDTLARSITDQLLVSTPDDVQLLKLRARLAQQQQNWFEVIASLEIVQQLTPSDDTRWQLAQIYLQQGYFALAQPHIRQLLSRNFDERHNRLLDMVDYLIARYQIKQSREILDTLLEKNSLTDLQRSHTLTSKAKLTRITESKSSFSRQITLLNKALHLNPFNGQALIALAELYEGSKADQAETLYQRASALPGVRLEALQRHAQLLLSQEAYQRAELLLQQAIKYAPENKQLRDNLTIVSRMVKSQTY